MAGESFSVPFHAHVELLRWFLARRAPIVERIQALLRAERKPPEFLQDTPLLARLFEECFFTLAGIPPQQAALRRQLEEAHAASGFKPRETPGLHNDVIDAAEMLSRGFRLWQQTRWPGNHGRLRYAHTLFSAYLLRRLMLLAMRLWDPGPSSATERLVQLQTVLDELRETTPAEQPVFVRDARWLFSLAQSPTTDELHGYFAVAERIATTLPNEQQLEILSASVRMAGGHLRSQLRHVSTQNAISLDDRALILSTRKSNALDVATLVQGLVPLLTAYEHAANGGDQARRLELADAILQGVSPDPELFLERLDLLRPYSLIEHLFVATDSAGRTDYTAMGRRHLRLVDEYQALITRLARALNDDCSHFRPVAGHYSPYGVLYGFSSRILEHMALKAAHADAGARFSIEDVFRAGGADQLAWVSGWRKLPHIPAEVAKQFEYPQAFAEEMFARIERALLRVAGGETAGAARTGRLWILADPHVPAVVPPLPDLPIEYVLSSDRALVAAQRATACDQAQLLHSRFEGEFAVSYPTAGGWVALSKDFLTELSGAGRDARVMGLPGAAAAVLQLMCPGFAVLDGNSTPGEPTQR